MVRTRIITNDTNQKAMSTSPLVRAILLIIKLLLNKNIGGDVYYTCHPVVNHRGGMDFTRSVCFWP